ncbi:hypothetical protein P3H15_32795 [Rhodococcus sp. T2V]|uniref:hypothetical protein n=1 Tax=Rhodococcus sp. T2V TaxID=3034164 RepID=UPI0023E32A2B|nr:hypothetical protein [Rhodococcus sp. T2V]MDF3309799.1 hypothetical protein [Rhodococcus sp. T2V]
MDDVLAWLGAIGGVLGGGAGLTFGILAFKQSKSSNKLAEDARDIAQRGEQLGTEANELARQSNGIAIDARQLAEEANTFSKRSELRETELHDVVWEGQWEEPGSYVLVNSGEHEALNVRATVDVDGEKMTIDAGVVGEGGRLTFLFPRARQEFSREVARKRQQEIDARRAPFGFVPTTFEQYSHTITERVLWQTQLGNPRTHEVTHKLAALGDWN